ncbi:hypothetical protein BCR44DRAFT_1387358, partial [Catenaria anguillulae PL171]
NIYSAVYSGVPVWEYMCNHVAVMRRKADSWLNATQLLKVANVEKARRTKILEREWATDSQHEKVQGGYGKYQGTWIPYERAVELCQKYKIETMVGPLLDFDPGTMTARPKPSNQHHHHQQQAMDTQSQSNSPLSPLTLQFDLAAAYASRTPITSAATTPVFANMQLPSTNPAGVSPHAAAAVHSPTEGSAAYRNQWMAVFLAGSDAQAQTLCRSADKSDVNRAMDAEGNTPMHWAAALGRISVLEDLVAHGADPLAVNKAGETPLMRAVNTAHNADGQSFLHVLKLCAPHMDAVLRVDRRGRSALHHIVRAAMDLSQGCKLSVAAVYYAQELTKYLMEELKVPRDDVIRLARICDVDGRKAVEVARGARNHDLVAHLVALDPAGSTEIVSGGCGMNSPLVSSLAAAAGERTAGMCE